MKRLQTAILLTILPLLTDCLKQNRSLCEVEDNLTLLFRYEPAVGTDRFAEYIGSVNVYLYDAEHKLMEARRIEKTDLELFQGTTFTVVPGDYYVVCWGNVSANSQFSGNGNGAPLSAGRVSAVSHKTGCKLYYAPFKNVGHPDGDVTDLSAYKITVPAQKAVKRTMLFVRAYRTINVYAQGYEDSYGGGDQPGPRAARRDHL